MNTNYTPDHAPFPEASPQVELFDNTEGKFILEVSDFKFISNNIKNGMALRFTVTWTFKHPQYGLLGASEEGWLCTRNAGGFLRVSPAIARFGPTSRRQLTTITPALHDLILAILVNNRTKAGKSLVDDVGASPLPEELRSKRPEQVDPRFAEFPKELTV